MDKQHIYKMLSMMKKFIKEYDETVLTEYEQKMIKEVISNYLLEVKRSLDD